jgi:glycosyltransferase involved in cell wall biosynthesis
MDEYYRSTIGFDARPLFRKRDGIGTYTEQSVLAASKIYPDCKFIGVIFKGDDHVQNIAGEMPKNVSITILPFKWRHYRAIAESGIWPKVDMFIGHKIDAFVYLNFVALPWVSSSIPKSIMIHDATYIKFPETLSTKNLHYLQKYVKKSINKQNVSAYTLSRHSANIFKDLLGVNFEVAPPGPSPLNIGPGSRNSDGSFLFIGTLEPRKNLKNLILAYNKLTNTTQKKHNLIIAGRSGWGDSDIYNMIKMNHNITLVDSPTNNQLENLYRKASCFVMPSIFEGFGIPTLDAVKFNLPVITSLDSPMEEILGPNGAIYIDPLKVDSIKNGLIEFDNASASKINSIVKASIISSSKYSWEKTAEIIFGKYLLNKH